MEELDIKEVDGNKICKYYDSFIDGSLQKSSNIITKTQYQENVNFYNSLRSEYIKNIIRSIIQNPRKYDYDKYFKLTKIKSNNNNKEINFILSIIKEELYDTDILFNVKISYRFIPRIYIKFYNPLRYSDKIKLKFDKLLKKSIKNDNRIIFLKSNIRHRDKFMAEFYARNFNLILGSAGYIFRFDNKHSTFPKYYYSVYTYLNSD